MVRVDVQRVDLAGVPAFYAYGTGKQVGAIVFRVGQADEPLLERGTTHLIEHLALSGLDGVHYSYNGGTGLTETSFYARGSGEEVISFLNHVVRSLANLPWDRAEAEADVLKAEAEQRSPSLSSSGLRALLGENHAGRIGTMELALDRLDLYALDNWRQTYFNRQNAALWFSGSPPLTAALDLSPLAEGQRQPVSPTVRIAPHSQLGLFGSYQSPAALTIAPRSQELSIGTSLIGRRLNDRLRGDLGVAYGASAQNEPLSGTESIVVLATQATHEQSDVVYEESQEELAKFVYNGGPSPEEIAWYYDMFVRAVQDPEAAPGAASNAASRELVGLPQRTDEQLAEQIRATQPQAVADVIAQVRDSFCWLIPQTAQIDDRRLGSIGDDIGERLKKLTHEFSLSKEHKQGLDDPKRKVTLVLADQGLMIDYNADDAMPGGDDFSKLALEDLQAAYVTSNGVWLFWSKRWQTLTVNPDNWNQKDRVTKRLEKLIPAEIIVRERADSTIARRERKAA